MLKKKKKKKNEFFFLFIQSHGRPQEAPTSLALQSVVVSPPELWIQEPVLQTCGLDLSSMDHMTLTSS